jgi:Nucleotidyl transferase AbiEii toxin, Type IV TA system
MTSSSKYGNPSAFRAALNEKLRNLANTGRWSLQQLQRQIAYDRLLERLYMVDDGWIVKGATALLARDIGVRGTVDVDIYREAASHIAEIDLRNASARDIGDWFRFEIGVSRELADANGARFPVKAFVGNTVWSEFHVDLVGNDLRMTGEPENVPSLACVAMPDVTQSGYRVYPLTDHVADKVCATFEKHGATGQASARYKDLVDLVAIVQAASIKAQPQMVAIRSEAKRRGLQLPREFMVPDRILWEPGYLAAASRSILPVARTLDEALEIVGPFLNPLLQGVAIGTWDPRESRWAE